MEFNKILLQTHRTVMTLDHATLSLLPIPSTSNGKQLYSSPLTQRNGEESDGGA